MAPTRNPLRRYLARRDAPSMRDLAKMAGVSHSNLSRYAAGLVTPGLAAAYSLEAATNGAVPARWWAKPRPRPEPTPEVQP